MTLAALVLSVAGATASSAQEAGRGSFVRIATDSARGSHVAGKLLSITHDSIAIEVDSATRENNWTPRPTRVALPLSDVTSVEARTATHRHGWAGLAIGGAAGGVFGGLAGVDLTKAAGGQCQSPKDVVACTMATNGRGNAGFGAVVGAVLGGLLGTIIGSVIVTEDWAPMNINATGRVELIPRSSGLGARLSFSFR